MSARGQHAPGRVKECREICLCISEDHGGDAGRIPKNARQNGMAVTAVPKRRSRNALVCAEAASSKFFSEYCFGAFFCFDGAERNEKGCYHFTVPCKRLLFLTMG